jgi:hypothetical protein
MFIITWHGYSNIGIAGAWLEVKFANGFGISAIHTVIPNRNDIENKHKYEAGIVIYEDRILAADHTKRELCPENLLPFYADSGGWLREDLTLEELNQEFAKIKAIPEEKYNELRPKYFKE